jgi:hypothetical protein
LSSRHAHLHARTRRASVLTGRAARCRGRNTHDPAQLDRLRGALKRGGQRSGPETGRPARVSFCGATSGHHPEEKLEAYDRGRQAGRRAVELAPRDAAAHFWYATNTARWGQTHGVVRSLFLLSTVREHLAIALELDPALTGAHVVTGYVYYEVPALLGGDLDRAEESFRTALAQVPGFTAAAWVSCTWPRARSRRRGATEAVLDEKSRIADWLDTRRPGSGSEGRE